LLIGLLASALTFGCGVVAKVKARSDMIGAKQTYISCVTMASSPYKCNSQRATYEGDLQAYQATYAGIHSGPLVTVQPVQRE
jgi:hypothetical protein